MTDDFVLHSTLERDTLLVGDLPLCRVLLMNDVRWPWIILVPRRSHLVELMDLDAEEQGMLMADISHISLILKSFTAAAKLNVAALGNIVPQLHVHVIARFTQDPAWPDPVFGFGERVAYPAEVGREFIHAVRTKLFA